MFITINGTQVPILGDSAEAAIGSHQFQDWVKTLDPKFSVRSILIQSVDFDTRGDKESRVRFIKFKAAVTISGVDLEPVVFMRGGSVGILVILECEDTGEEYTLLTIQPRFPIGSSVFPEIIAGTLENDGTFAGGAARELEEEADIKITEEDLADLISLIYGDRFKGVFPTAGGSDEFLRLFAYRQKVNREYLASLQGKCTGLACENEQITLKVVKLDDLVHEAPDAKALSALMLYCMCRAKNLL